MLKLAQRAYEYSDSKYPVNDIANKEECHINWVATRSYIIGAQTQHKIDIEKACQWLKNNIIDYTGVTVRSYNGEDEEHIIEVFNEFFIDFRKAMEE